MFETRWIEPELAPGPRRDRAIDRGLRRHAEHASSAAVGPEDLIPCGCLTALLASYLDASAAPLRALDDEEGTQLPSALPPVTDAHVHLFPDPVFEALWRWFDAYGWPIRYKLHAPEVIRFQLERGVERLFALHYAHKPGMSRSLNTFIADLCRTEPRVVGFGTVLPGEPDAVATLEEAKALGLRAVKLHCHVQGFAPDSSESLEVFETCARLGLPVLIHAGREPKSDKYRVDPYTTCAAPRMESVVRAFPKLNICVPHFGANEYEAYASMLERYDNFYVDTTMVVAGFFPDEPTATMITRRPERVMFGTDFPNLPYAWDRELRRLIAMGLPESSLATLLSGTASRFLSPT